MTNEIKQFVQACTTAGGYILLFVCGVLIASKIIYNLLLELGYPQLIDLYAIATFFTILAIVGGTLINIENNN